MTYNQGLSNSNNKIWFLYVHSPCIITGIQICDICTVQRWYFKLLRSPGIDYKESASLSSLVGRYDNPIPTRFLAPIHCSKVPALCILCPELPQHSILSGTQIWLTVPFLSSAPRKWDCTGSVLVSTHTHTSLCPSIPLPLCPSSPLYLCFRGRSV